MQPSVTLSVPVTALSKAPQPHQYIVYVWLPRRQAYYGDTGRGETLKTLTLVRLDEFDQDRVLCLLKLSAGGNRSMWIIYEARQSVQIERRLQ